MSSPEIVITLEQMKSLVDKAFEQYENANPLAELKLGVTGKGEIESGIKAIRSYLKMTLDVNHLASLAADPTYASVEGVPKNDTAYPHRLFQQLMVEQLKVEVPGFAELVEQKKQELVKSGQQTQASAPPVVLAPNTYDNSFDLKIFTPGRSA